MPRSSGRGTQSRRRGNTSGVKKKPTPPKNRKLRLGIGGSLDLTTPPAQRIAARRRPHVPAVAPALVDLVNPELAPIRAHVNLVSPECSPVGAAAMADAQPPALEHVSPNTISQRINVRENGAPAPLQLPAPDSAAVAQADNLAIVPVEAAAPAEVPPAGPVFGLFAKKVSRVQTIPAVPLLADENDRAKASLPSLLSSLGFQNNTARYRNAGGHTAFLNGRVRYISYGDQNPAGSIAPQEFFSKSDVGSCIAMRFYRLRTTVAEQAFKDILKKAAFTDTLRSYARYKQHIPNGHVLFVLDTTGIGLDCTSILDAIESKAVELGIQFDPKDCLFIKATVLNSELKAFATPDSHALVPVPASQPTGPRFSDPVSSDSDAAAADGSGPNSESSSPAFRFFSDTSVGDDSTTEATHVIRTDHSSSASGVSAAHPR
jgi:hypothetical protein